MRVARAAVAVVLMLALLPAVASAREPWLPQQGVYESCAPDWHGDAGCLDRLAEIRAGGFTVVLNYALLHRSAGQLLAYARRAEELGIELIWSLKDESWWGPADAAQEFHMVAQSCGCSDERALLAYVVGLARESRATWGYYVGDETHRRHRRAVVSFSRRVHRLDPSRPRLFVAQEGPATRGSNLRPFTRAADVLGADSYPVSTHDPISTVATVSATAHRLARRSRKRSAAVLQSFSWAQYPGHNKENRRAHVRWPTRGEMRHMRDLASRHRHRLLLWYSYFDVKRSDDPERRWRDLRWAAFGS